jgi:DNA uptake protein ComE-like DNA-binding protein
VPDWKRQIREYLNFSKTERNGLIVLFGLLMMIILINIALPLFIDEDEIDFSDFREQVEEFARQQEIYRDSINRSGMNSGKEKYRTKITLTPFTFDPNHLPAEKWRAMGLTDYQTSMIKNYESKGGVFRTKEDLAKIYCISEDEFNQLLPFIKIDTSRFISPELSAGISVLNPYFFDPNTVSREELFSMGMRESLINSIINYRKSGGRFYLKEDFRKIYTLTPEEINALEPFIVISADSAGNGSFMEMESGDQISLDLNLSDTLDLQQLPGIGPSFASRIVKYREILGGYSRKEQLLEVYGIDSARYAGISKQVYVQALNLRKIDINLATIKDLMKHPYIEFYLAKSIVVHREKIGKYSRLEELLDARLIYKDLYDKIMPYLTLNENE